MAAEVAKRWVEATQLDAVGQAFGPWETFTSGVLAAEHVLSLTLKRDVTQGLSASLDVQRSNAGFNWDDFPGNTEDTLDREMRLAPGFMYRARAKVVGGLANEQGEFYGEISFRIDPYSEQSS